MKKILIKLIRKFYKSRVLRKAKGSCRNLLVNGYSSLNNDTSIGDFCSINGLEIVGIGKVEIGDYLHSGTDILFITSNHNYKGESIPYDKTHIIKKITIEDFVWIGSKVIILAGVTIGEGAIIQAGAVVTSNVPKLGIAGGNPAKTFMYRDKDHFDKLKIEKKFHQ